MSDACYCDYESPLFWVENEPVARKEHRCYECHRPIPVGMKHWTVRATWERGDPPRTFRRCASCHAAKQLVKAHVPCFCDSVGGLWEEIEGTVDHYYSELLGTGVLFALGRIKIASRRRALLPAPPAQQEQP